MSLCFVQEDSLNPRFQGQILDEDVEGFFFKVIDASIADDLEPYIPSVTGAAFAFWVKFRSLIRIKSYDPKIIKEYGGLPLRARFGTYNFAIADFNFEPLFICVEQQVTFPSFTWVAEELIPDEAPFGTCTSVQTNFTVRDLTSAISQEAKYSGNRILFNFEDSVIADILTLYVGGGIAAFQTPGTTDGLFFSL